MCRSRAFFVEIALLPLFREKAWQKALLGTIHSGRSLQGDRELQTVPRSRYVWQRRRGAACGRNSRAGVGAAVQIFKRTASGAENLGNGNPDLRPGTMQSFLIAWFSLLRKRLSFCTLAAVRLTREWSFSRFRKLPVCAPARRKVCSDSWIRINSKSKHTNKTPPPAEKSGKFHFQAWFWPFGMVVCIFAVISGGIQIPMDTKSSLCRASHRTRAQPGRNVSAAQSATLCHPIKSGQSAWYPVNAFSEKEKPGCKKTLHRTGAQPRTQQTSRSVTAPRNLRRLGECMVPSEVLFASFFFQEKGCVLSCLSMLS